MNKLTRHKLYRIKKRAIEQYNINSSDPVSVDVFLPDGALLIIDGNSGIHVVECKRTGKRKQWRKG